MPVPCQTDPSADSGPPNHSSLMAVRGLGFGYSSTFPKAVGGYEFLFLAIDKFTKWPEAEPVRKITVTAAVKFIRGIFVRFSVANRIITDNGTQFTSAAFVEFCEEMGTKICYASPAHP